VAAGVQFSFKQWNGRSIKATGRELVGIKWNEMPGGEDELIAPSPLLSSYSTQQDLSHDILDRQGREW
jgi:hypothetical protein